jgi:NADH:ubiquinone oxidoreductase subunit E
VNPNNPSCAAPGSKKIMSKLTQQLQKKNVSMQCLGYCNVGSNIRLILNGEIFHEVSVKKFTEITHATKGF